MKAILFAKAPWDQKCFKNARFGPLILDSLMWKLCLSPPKAKSRTLHPSDAGAEPGGSDAQAQGQVPASGSQSRGCFMAEPCDSHSLAGTAPPGQGQGLSQAPSPRSKPKSEVLPWGPWEHGISAPHLFQPPGKGALQVFDPHLSDSS